MDILEKLRDLQTAVLGPERRSIIWEAAAEVERLRAALKEIIHLYDVIDDAEAAMLYEAERALRGSEQKAERDKA